jgi:signal peptidase I
MTIKGIGRGAREVFLTIGALLGVLCIIATVAGVAFGVKPLVFRSGSMSPAIHTGDLAVSRTVDARDLKIGDIVSVVNSEGNRVTHRLVNIASQGNARQLTLKGDDNRVADAEVYTVTKAERVLFDIPKAGYVVNAAASPAGVFVLGAYVTAMLLLVFRRRGPTDGDGDGSSAPRRKGGSRKADTKGPRVTPRMIAVTAFAASIAVATPAAATPWTNDVVIGGGTFTAKVVPAPVASCGSLGLLSVRFNWTAVTGATGYVLHYGSGGGTTETVGSGTTTKLLTAALAGGTFYVQTQINYGSSTWTSASSNTLSYTVAVVSLCS